MEKSCVYRVVRIGLGSPVFLYVSFRFNSERINENIFTFAGIKIDLTKINFVR